MGAPSSVGYAPWLFTRPRNSSFNRSMQLVVRSVCHRAPAADAQYESVEVGVDGLEVSQGARLPGGQAALERRFDQRTALLYYGAP